jgi:ATP-binding cassette, subfamily F, member 2
MKDYVAKFGHGTAKNAKQAQSKEKTLDKMVRSGLTDKVTPLTLEWIFGHKA